ncbi:MAG: MFS transporter, partial [Eubacteriales bacterium]|nr:MFS transporter [Eubacteriales bacterium]
MTSKNLSFKYSAQQFLYWAAVSCIVSFAASYLLANGFNASETGRILFTANFISFFLQPVVAGKADQSEKNIILRIMLILTGITAVSFLAVRFVPMPKIVYSVVYIVGMASLDMEVPLMNSENVYYTDRGWSINYGLARAVGSAAYSLMSLCLGYVIELFGAGWVPVISVSLMLALFAFIAVMPKDESESFR